MDISREHIQLGKYFSKGGETYTEEELARRNTRMSSTR
jgi:hypothetical protein